MNKVNIECAKATIGKYKKELLHLENSDYIEMSFNTPKSCAYCEAYYRRELRLLQPTCIGCPLSIDNTVGCMDFYEMDIIDKYVIDEDESDYTLEDYINAIEDRIKVHERLIENKGQLAEEDVLLRIDYKSKTK